MKDRIVALVGVFPLAAVSFYAYGNIYDDTFLGHLGIEASLFPLNYDHILMEGGSHLFITCLYPVIFAVLAAEAIFITSVVMKAVDEALEEWRPSKAANSATAFPKVWNPFAEKKSKSVPEQAFHIMSAVLLAFVLFFLLIFTADRDGRESAERYLSRINTKEIPSSELKLKSATNPISAVIVRCSPTHCAYISNGIATVVPLADIDKIITQLAP